MFVLIGCPVYDRAWILPHYFEAIEKQDFPQKDLGFLFLVSPGDKPTIDELVKFSSRHPEYRVFGIIHDDESEHIAHPEPAPDGSGDWRSWKAHPNRFQTMVSMRNNLLNHVISLEPDYYFSLDSDILLTNPSTISTLIECMSFADAASPLMYMFPTGTAFPSVMTWVDGGVGTVAYRPPYPIGTRFQADVIMAAVMMSKPVYQTVRYQYHSQGEDLGWSTDATTKGFSLWSISDLYAPHIMSRYHLSWYLQQGDLRAPKLESVI